MSIPTDESYKAREQYIAILRIVWNTAQREVITKDGSVDGRASAFDRTWSDFIDIYTEDYPELKSYLEGSEELMRTAFVYGGAEAFKFPYGISNADISAMGDR